MTSVQDQNSLNEQSAAAAMLAVLERRRDKTRALKQAMMQELLTGRTRLV
jgi:type I restriction enzyme S subunit